MQSMTIEQLGAVSNAGGVMGVTLMGQGGAFLVHIATRNGADAVLAQARSSEPRRFGNPLAALNVLLGIGITAGKFDATAYEPAAYNHWLAGEIAAAIDDSRPSIPHDEVMAEMDAEIAALIM